MGTSIEQKGKMVLITKVRSDVDVESSTGGDGRFLQS